MDKYLLIITLKDDLGSTENITINDVNDDIDGDDALSLVNFLLTNDIYFPKKGSKFVSCETVEYRRISSSFFS